MDFSLNLHSEVAVYMQIENQVKFAIARGELKEGDKLPGIQKLAKEIGANPNTVMKAYRELELVGLVSGRHGYGTFVNRDIHAKCEEECRSELIKKLHEVAQEAKASGMSKKALLDVIGKSLAANSNPYDEAPASVLKLARKK